MLASLSKNESLSFLPSDEYLDFQLNYLGTKSTNLQADDKFWMQERYNQAKRNLPQGQLVKLSTNAQTLINAR